MTSINYSEKIPNNVDLSGDRTLQRALEQWQPNFINWWDDMGPEGSTDMEVYLRTAVSVDPQGWAQFGHVKMRDYRWGIFMNPGEQDRKIHFGDHKGEAAWQDVPGEHRANLRRIIVTQGDTEPASVEQQRHLGLTCPSQYDLRNLFQVNVEEGRHLWAMVYLLHSYFGRDGRDEAEELLGKHVTFLLHPGKMDEVLRYYERQFKDRLAATYQEIPARERDGVDRSIVEPRPLVALERSLDEREIEPHVVADDHRVARALHPHAELGGGQPREERRLRAALEPALLLVTGDLVDVEPGQSITLDRVLLVTDGNETAEALVKAGACVTTNRNDCELVAPAELDAVIVRVNKLVTQPLVELYVPLCV